MLVTIIVALVGSSGVWGVMNLIVQKRDASTQLTLGLAQHTIVSEGRRILEQGYITTDEHLNLHKGLYLPYVLMGGNGLAEKMIKEIDKLPFRRDL